METEAEKPKMCSCKCGKGAVAVILIFLIAGVICWYVHHPNRTLPSIELKPGTICIVHFRDALDIRPRGLNAPTTTIRDGRVVSALGEVIAVNQDAIILEQVNYHYFVNGVPQMKRFWIPKSSILFIEYHSSETTRSFSDLSETNPLWIEFEVQRRMKERQ